MNVASTVVDVLPLALLGALLGLDVVSFPQAMISRPIVSATLAGALMGHGGSGLLAGAVLELVALDTLPFGAARYPEWGSAGVVGGALYAVQPVSRPGALPVAVLGALLTAVASGASMVVLRKAIARRARALRDPIDAGSERAVNALQLFGLTGDLLRGGVVTLVALLVLAPIASAIVAVWGVDVVRSRAVVAAVTATVAIGAVWKIFHTTARTGWFFLAGLTAGTGLLLVR